MKNIEEIIMSLGLSREESQVYLSILKKGPSTPTEISKTTDIKRTTAINYIESLLRKGILQMSIVGKRTYYVAESPEKLLENLEKKKNRFASVIPELNSLYLNASHKAHVRYFEGKSGIQKIYKEVSTGFLPIISFYSLDRYLDMFQTMDVMDEFIENIRKNENSIRDLMEDTISARKIMQYRNANRKSWKYLPENFILSVDIMIQGEKLAIISFSSEMGIIIENKGIAEFHRSTFEHLWNSLDVKKG